MEKGARSQESGARRKAIKIKLLSTTCYDSFILPPTSSEALLQPPTLCPMFPMQRTTDKREAMIPTSHIPHLQSSIYNLQSAMSLRLAWFLHFEKTTKITNQFLNKIKTYKLQICVCYCFIGKNYLLFFFVVFLLS